MGFNVSPTGHSISVNKIFSVTPNTVQHLHVSYVTSNSNTYSEFVKDVTGTAKRSDCVVDTSSYISINVNLKVSDVGTAVS